MGVYQKYRGNPETKLFFLLENFLGGINTEFSDDNSNDVDFDSIINFEMDKLGTLNKRGGFGELSALSQIFDQIEPVGNVSRLPVVYNRTSLTPSPESENNNIVYAKLLQNDNGCFRALAGFSGEKAYRKYQELYGFQNNRFKLLIITSDFITDGVPSSSTAFYYDVYLPELERNQQGNITDTETIEINAYVTTLPLEFNWDRNLMNVETIEFYDKIHFTSNNKGLVTFDRSAAITSNSTLANAFTYSGFSESASGGPTVTNNAHVPSGLEIRHIGFNVLCDNPMTSINTTGITNDTIQAIFVCTTDNIPLLNLPLGQSFILNIIYTGLTSDFTITMKEGDNDLSFTKSTNSTYTRAGLASYDISFNEVPNGEVEIKIVKDTTSTALEPYYDYYNVEQVDSEAKPVSKLDIGDYGICEMYNRAVYYKDDTIWFSDINDFTYIPNYNYLTLPIEPTDKITKICYFKKAYIVFTKQKIYKLVGSFGQSDFALQPVNTSLGCHAGNTVVPIEDTLFFASPRGLYALRSSTFVEGFENVKELDIKVKKLTNNFTKFDDDLAQPSIRYNGISERAYATRYKDKYLLFYNNYGSKGDYAAENDLDTLVYQFDIGSFTTYRFKEKPTFLFMVDNAIETFSTVVDEPDYDTEETIVEYDFDETEGTTVEDLSGNGRTGYIKGGYGIVGNKGITLNGETSNIQTNIKDIDFTNGFNIKLDLNSTTVTDNDFIYIPLFRFNNYEYTFPEFSQTQTSEATVRIPSIVTYRMINAVTYTYKQLSSGVVQITPTIELTLNSPVIKNGTVAYTIKGLETTYVTASEISVRFDNEFKTNLTGTSFLVPTNSETFIEDLLTLELECVTDQGTFTFVDIRDIRDTVSLTNLAYGGTSTDLPYYEFYGYIDGETGKLTTGIWTTGNIGVENYVVDNDYSLISNQTYDFKTMPKQVLDIRFKKIGSYLNCSSYINNELYEDLGYFPIQLIENLVSRADNKVQYATQFKGNINYIETYLKGVTSKYNLTEGENAIAYDDNGYFNLLLTDCEWISQEGKGLIFDGENIYVEMPTLPPSIPFEQGFSIEFEGDFPLDYSAKIFDIATLYDNGNAENKNGSINCYIENGLIGFSTNSLNFKSFKNSILLDNIVLGKHKYKFDCKYTGNKIYTLDVYIDDGEISVATYSFIGAVSNALRTSNFIGRSNTITDNLLKGSLNNFKISVYVSENEVSYRNALYEFDISPTDFGKDIYIEAITKGINMKYPQHMKKLKHIFVKAIGGNKYGEFFFELYADGHMVNDPRKFYVYKDENGTLVYDYTGERIFSLDEINSTLGNIRLDETKLGEGKYQTKKMVIPKKAKNFSCRIYGNTDDYISLESLGFVCKLGKVKEG